MSNQEIHQQLISYLYGELPSEEVAALKKKLAAEQSLEKEVNELKQIKDLLHEVKDEPIKQPLVLTTYDNKEWRHWFRNPWLQVAVAAILLMLTAALVNLRIRVVPHELRVQFGSPQPNQTVLTQSRYDSLQIQQQQQFARILASHLSAQQDSFQREISDINQLMSDKWKAINHTLGTLSQQEDTLRLSDTQLRVLRTQLMRENYQMLTDLVEYSHEYHREYTAQLVADFARYMEQQRIQDLEMISLALNQILEQNDVQQQETEYLLSALISYVQQDQPINR